MDSRWEASLKPQVNLKWRRHGDASAVSPNPEVSEGLSWDDVGCRNRSTIDQEFSMPGSTYSMLLAP
jgi:hypothetical protein